MYKVFKKQPDNIELPSNHKVARNIYFNSIRQAKQDCWENFLQNTIKGDIFKAYNYTKSRQSDILAILNYKVGANKVAASNFEDKCEALLTTLYSTSNNMPQSQIPPLNKSQCEIGRAHV